MPFVPNYPPVGEPLAMCAVAFDGTFVGTRFGVLSSVRTGVGRYTLTTTTGLTFFNGHADANVFTSGRTIVIGYFDDDTFNIETNDAATGLAADSDFMFRLSRRGISGVTT